MKPTVHIILCVLTLLTAACSATKSSSPAPSEPLSLDKEQVWQLVQVQGRSVARTAPAVTLVFNPEAGTLHGQAACNSYGANYLLGSQASNGGRELKVSALSGSRVQCPEAQMNAEARYLSLLRKATALSLDDAGTTLILSQGDKTLLTFELQ